MGLQKIFIALGLLFLLMGVFWRFIGKIPGDILIKRENMTIYFPIMTSIIVSIVLSFILWIIGKIK